MVLLVLLGLYNSQQSEHTVDCCEPEDLEQAFLASGLLPLEPALTSPQVFSNSRYPGRYLEHMRLCQETLLSKLANDKFEEARWINGEISPDLLQRTGQFIHSNSGVEIPS